MSLINAVLYSHGVTGMAYTRVDLFPEGQSISLELSGLIQ